jgi:dienelactone hydrolase
LTRGGAWTDDFYHISHLIESDDFDRSPGNGMRLASYTDADSILSRFTGRIERDAPRDFNQVVAASASEYEMYRHLYDYDARPLETRLEAEGETDAVRWQKLSFTAAYDGPRMAAYLLIPRHVSPPYVPIILWPHAGAMSDRVFNPRDPLLDVLTNFMLQSGRALVMPLYLGAYERHDSTLSRRRAVPDSSTAASNLFVHWIQDLRRTVDFLETRQDLRSDRIGYYGVSWGGATAPVALALEPRIRAAVLNSAGYLAPPTRPEIFPPNFSPHVRTPVLMLNGRYDTVFPYETSQLAMFRQLGTAPADKEIHVEPNGHIIPNDSVVPLGLAWFDKYLSTAPKKP